MSLIIDLIEQTWSLLQTLGWWIAVGLVLSVVIQCLPCCRRNEKKKWWSLLPAVVGGALLPMCNFSAIPLAIAVFRRGARTGITLAFLSAAALLNPAGILSAYAYMGPALTMCYVCGAIVLALLVGIAGQHCPGLEPPRAEPQRYRFSEALRNTFFNLGPELAFWVFWGTLAEAALLTFTPTGLRQSVLLDPESASFLEGATMGICRHVCIPDDISQVASLVAAGLRPGCAVLFLLMGVCTNLPELFVLLGMAGKKMAVLFGGVTAAASIIVALLTELAIGSDFVPQFNLANAGIYTQLANLLSIRTWIPARVPCAILLLVLAGHSFWIQMKSKMIFSPIRRPD